MIFFKSLISFYFSQVDIFNGLNNDILAREGLVALDMKHSVSPGPVTPVMMMIMIMVSNHNSLYPQVATPLSHSSLRESMGGGVTPGPGPISHIKQDMMYPVTMASPTPPNSRQVNIPVCSHEYCVSFTLIHLSKYEKVFTISPLKVLSSDLAVKNC